MADAIRSGIFNDLGSGSNVDLTAILKDGTVKVMRNFDKANPKPELHLDYSYKRGTTGTLAKGYRQFTRALRLTQPTWAFPYWICDYFSRAHVAVHAFPAANDG